MKDLETKGVMRNKEVILPGGWFGREVETFSASLSNGCFQGHCIGGIDNKESTTGRVKDPEFGVWLAFAVVARLIRATLFGGVSGVGLALCVGA